MFTSDKNFQFLIDTSLAKRLNGFVLIFRGTNSFTPFLGEVLLEIMNGKDGEGNDRGKAATAGFKSKRGEPL